MAARGGEFFKSVLFISPPIHVDTVEALFTAGPVNEFMAAGPVIAVFHRIAFGRIPMFRVDDIDGVVARVVPIASAIFGERDTEFGRDLIDFIEGSPVLVLIVLMAVPSEVKEMSGDALL